MSLLMLRLSLRKLKEAIDEARQVMSSPTPEEETSRDKVNPDLPDEGDKDEHTESHPSSPAPQFDPSQAHASPFLDASPSPEAMFSGH